MGNDQMIQLLRLWHNFMSYFVQNVFFSKIAYARSLFFLLWHKDGVRWIWRSTLSQLHLLYGSNEARMLHVPWCEERGHGVCAAIYAHEHGRVEWVAWMTFCPCGDNGEKKRGRGSIVISLFGAPSEVALSMGYRNNSTSLRKLLVKS